ncbi:MAG: recombination mediator RecR [Cystobacterineae bacterium]|nr:recombination mediator RecR [Cystobacterineae bacterium]
MTPETFNQLVALLARLPSIGEKTAQRMAFFLLRSPPNYGQALAKAIQDTLQKVQLCPRCFSLTETAEHALCKFCEDSRRDAHLLCVVESIGDQLAIEKTREFNGHYHILHGALSPLEGIGPEKLRIRELLSRLSGSATTEVIIATNPNVEGDTTALYLTKLLRPMGLKLTRLAQGLPMGGDLEYADKATLAHALTARNNL